MVKGPAERLWDVLSESSVKTPTTDERDAKKRDEIIRHRIESRGEAIESQVERLNAPKGTSLCFRCTHSHIYRRKVSFTPVIRCHELEGCDEVADDIEECNRFKQTGKLTIWELMQIAQPILIDGKDSAGFYY